MVDEDCAVLKIEEDVDTVMALLLEELGLPTPPEYDAAQVWPHWLVPTLT